jgi:predicted phage gp36 major capsid-like protein
VTDCTTVASQPRAFIRSSSSNLIKAMVKVAQMNVADDLRKPSNASSIEEAQALIRQCAEPRPAGDQVKAAVRRASTTAGLAFFPNARHLVWRRKAHRSAGNGSASAGRHLGQSSQTPSLVSRLSGNRCWHRAPMPLVKLLPDLMLPCVR